jgi:hypothetical protein
VILTSQHQSGIATCDDMSESVSDVKAAKVQKLCTLWTHDDNFSRDDIVFHGERFPELPTTPGTLLQIVPTSSKPSDRDLHATEIGIQTDEPRATTEGPGRDAGARVQVKKRRRGSNTLTIEEHASTIPSRRHDEVEKAFIFTVAGLPADLRSKRIAKVFGFRNRMQVIVTEVRLLTANASIRNN